MQPPQPRPRAAHPVPLSTEARRYVRLLGEAVRAADDRYMAALPILCRPLRDRLTRHPERSMRQDLLADLACGVRRLEPAWRLALDVTEAGKHVFVLADHRVIYSEFVDPAWVNPEWQASLAVCRETVTASNAHGVSVKTTILGNVSGHALGRFFERQPRHGYSDLVHDLRPLLTSATADHVACRDGFWIGPINRTHAPDGRQFNTRSVQSYLAAESLPDDLPARAARSGRPILTPA